MARTARVVGLENLRAKNKKIVQLLTKDPITMLSNRPVFERDVNALIQKKEPFSIYKMGIDNFKFLNDLHGLDYGDLFLNEVSSAIRELNHLKAYRWSGDEIFIIEETILRKDIEHTIRQLNDIVRKPVDLDGMTYNATSSIGIVRFPSDGNNLTELYRGLDLALNAAKTNGKNQHSYFYKTFLEEIRYASNLKDELNAAMKEDHLRLIYQPIYQMESGKIKGLEILLRWPNNSFKEHNIGNIIHFAEKTGQILSVDKWVVHNAFKSIKSYCSALGSTLISINISAQSFHSEEFYEHIIYEAKKHSIDPHYIELEITEYSIVQDVKRSKVMMDRLKKLGFRIALDDFGTKYSSLNYLSKLPFDTLKIDKSYVDYIAKNSKDRIIVEHIIHLTRELGITTIAEGVEFEEQNELLHQMGCSYGQGYYKSKPMDLVSAISYL